MYTNVKGWNCDQLWDWLLKKLKEGKPILVDLAWVKSGGDLTATGRTGHYVVIVGGGIKDGKKQLLIEHWDGYQLASWDGEWNASNGDKMQSFCDLWKNGHFGPNAAIVFEKPAEFKPVEIGKPVKFTLSDCERPEPNYATLAASYPPINVTVDEYGPFLDYFGLHGWPQDSELDRELYPNLLPMEMSDFIPVEPPCLAPTQPTTPPLPPVIIGQ